MSKIDTQIVSVENKFQTGGTEVCSPREPFFAPRKCHVSNKKKTFPQIFFLEL